MTPVGGLRAILFDFDYTLGDSSRAAVDCMRHALRQMGLPDRDPETCARTIGLSLRDTLVALAGPEAAEQFDTFHRYFRQRADEIMAPWTALYPFTLPLLTALRARGLRLGIVSNKEAFRIRAILSRFVPEDPVDAIVGPSDAGASKPAPDGLLVALRRLEVPACAALYVGDSTVDARAAAAAGLPLVAVTTGHTSAAELEPYRPATLLPDAGALLDWLDAPR
ncbi:MAG: HAD family hydrolase [Anaerolineae bacterium]|jgi:phosphoglycolate phosphatase|nr:HAD-IA family hydrolase [Chloroflexota bacterium]